MKQWIGLALLVFVGAAGWRIGAALSPDALSIAVGVLFGVMAGVPTALLVMAGSRRRAVEERGETNNQRQQQRQPIYVNGPVSPWGMPYAQPPPVIVVAGPQGFGNAPQAAYSSAGWLPQEPPDRQFTVVGNGEELTEDW